MNILQNAWIAISAIGVVFGLISSLIAIRDYIKNGGGNNMKKIFNHPLKNNLFWSLTGTLMCILLFYICGGFNKETNIHEGKKNINKNIPKNDTTHLSTVKKLSEPVKTVHKKVIQVENTSPKQLLNEKVKQDNSITVTSSPGAHVVGGTAKVDINGDVTYINKEKTISENELNAIYYIIINSTPEQRKLGVFIMTLPYMNAPNTSNKITKYLTKRGIDIEGIGPLYPTPNSPIIDRVKVDTNNPMGIRILIGYFKD